MSTTYRVKAIVVGGQAAENKEAVSEKKTVTVDGLQVGKNYYFVAKAENSAGESEESTPTEYITVDVEYKVQVSEQLSMTDYIEARFKQVSDSDFADELTIRDFATSDKSLLAGPPIITRVTAYDKSALVEFLPPENPGHYPIDFYVGKVYSQSSGKYYYWCRSTKSPLRMTFLTNGVDYTFQISAHTETYGQDGRWLWHNPVPYPAGGTGYGVWSDPTASATPAPWVGLPLAPYDVGVTANGSSGGFWMVWYPPISDTPKKYTIYARPQICIYGYEAVKWEVSPSVGVNTFSVDEFSNTAKLVDGVLYKITVSATNATGEGPESEPVFFTTYKRRTPLPPSKVWDDPYFALESWTGPDSNRTTGSLNCVNLCFGQGIDDTDISPVLGYTLMIDLGYLHSPGRAFAFASFAIEDLMEYDDYYNAYSGYGTCHILRATGLDKELTGYDTYGAGYTGAYLVSFNKYGLGEVTAHFDIAVLNQLSHGFVEPTFPGPPKNVVCTPSKTSVSVAFDAPTYNGGDVVTSYSVKAIGTAFTATGASSPLVISGLAQGVEYFFIVTATNSIGTGSGSVVSDPIIPNTHKVANTLTLSDALRYT